MKQEPIVKREGVEEVVTEVDEEVVEDEERKLQEELKQREEEAKKQLEEQAERKRKKDLELKKQRDELEKRIKEEHDRRLKEDAIKKQKQTLQRQSQGKRIKPRENPKPITINISKAGMFTPEATPTTARASPPLGAAAAAPPKVTQIVNPGEKGVSKSEEGIMYNKLVANGLRITKVAADGSSCAVSLGVCVQLLPKQGVTITTNPFCAQSYQQHAFVFVWRKLVLVNVTIKQFKIWPLFFVVMTTVTRATLGTGTRTEHRDLRHLFFFFSITNRSVLFI